MEVDERGALGDRLAAGLGEPGFEVDVVADDEPTERCEQDLLLVLEVVVYETRGKVGRFGDVRDGGAVVAALGHHLHQRSRDLRLSLLCVRWSRHGIRYRLDNQPTIIARGDLSRGA